jgi:hypothetical protein
LLFVTQSLVLSPNEDLFRPDDQQPRKKKQQVQRKGLTQPDSPPNVSLGPNRERFVFDELPPDVTIP